MFKSILPSRKVPDGEFCIVSPPADSHKENYPATVGPASTVSAPKVKTEKRKKAKEQDVVPDVAQTEQAFDQLLVCLDYRLGANTC